MPPGLSHPGLGIKIGPSGLTASPPIPNSPPGDYLSCFQCLHGGKTLEQMDSGIQPIPPGSSPYLEHHQQVAYFQQLENLPAQLVWHVQCLSIWRSEGSPVGTQMAVAYPNRYLTLGRPRMRAVYVNFALFCKMRDARNAISRLMHAITHRGLSAFDFRPKPLSL